MKLLRLTVGGFGSLRGEHRFDPGRLTLVVDDNERGKSTLLAAVAAGLYGLSDDRRAHRQVTPAERWRPWDGGSFAVELEFECGGNRYVVQRDFAAQTVAVHDGSGQEVTPRFLEGKDEYPVGKHLLGLDLEEFEKCAFVRQEDLAEVIPYDEKERRVNPLQIRLERAADTRAGNSSAAEALRVLDEAAARYHEPLLDATIKVETAIQRLDAKRLEIETELHAIEHDHTALAGSVERLATLEEHERDAQALERRIEIERRAVLCNEAQVKLDEHRTRAGELARLKLELSGLSAYAELPHDADARFQEAAGRLEEIGKHAERLQDVVHQLDDAVARLDQELAGLSMFAQFQEPDADRFVAAAADLRRLDSEYEQVSQALESARAELTSRGFDQATIVILTQCFGGLAPDQMRMLELQPEISLELEALTADAESSRDMGLEALEIIGRERRSRATPGWVGIGIGAAAAIVAAFQMMQPLFAVPGGAIAAGAAVVGFAGLAQVLASSRHRREESLAAREAITGADERLAELQTRRHDQETELAALREVAGIADTRDMIRSFTEYQRYEREREPVSLLEGMYDQVVHSREQILSETGHPPDAAFLDRVAAGIRVQTAKLQKRAEFDEQRSRVRVDLDPLLAQRDEHEAVASAILAAAGLERAEGGAWTDLAPEVARRTQAARRYAALTGEAVPRLERELLNDEMVQLLEQSIEAFRSQIAGAPPAPGGRVHTLAELEIAAREARNRLEKVRQERTELQHRVDDGRRRYQQLQPEKSAERDAWERALLRARRFKQAVDVARETITQVAHETHRRWAEFLNERVGDVLKRVGTGVEVVRFGEDLDFAVTPKRGKPAARGKAVRQLSSGARDQVHLAVRLAISEYLSREEALPLLIDDCFITSDDERARAGMKLLLEQVSREHQVILVTCHRRRFESLAGMDPDLYRDRVHWVDTAHMRSIEAEQRV